MALYSLLLDVNFNSQSLTQFPFSRVAGSAPKGQDNEGRGRKSPQAGMGGCGGAPWGPHSSSPSFPCIYIRNWIVQMEELSNSIAGENDISQLLLKKKINKEGRGKLLMNHAWPTG